MGAFEELTSDGVPGPATLGLVARAFRAVIRRHNYPPPSGAGDWTPDELADVQQAFLTERGTERFSQLCALATDEASLRRGVSAAVHRFLVDRTRETRRGRLFVRFRADLREDPKFEEVAKGRWSLRGGPSDPAEFDADRLTAVAWTLQLRVSPWGDDTEREGPPADSPSRVRLLETVLGEAEGSLTVAELAAVGERRFPFYGRPAEVSIDGWDEYALPASPPADSALGASDEARRVWDSLTARQQAVVPHLELSARNAAAALGMGRTAAHNAQIQARALLAELLGPDRDEEVVRELVLLSEAGMRTQQAGSPSGLHAGPLAAAGPGDHDEDERG